MARDYKYRARQQAAHHRDSKKIAGWKWVAALLLAAGFTGFLMYLRSLELAEQRAARQATPVAGEPKPNPAPQSVADATPSEKTKTTAKKPQEPRFEFYTILPKQEVVVPEHEIKTRKREEHVGKAQPGTYVIQAASFRNLKDADALKARLAMMGIESTIEPAQIGNAQWHRVKIGPLASMSNVDTLRMQLRKNGIDAVVMQIKP